MGDIHTSTKEQIALLNVFRPLIRIWFRPTHVLFCMGEILSSEHMKEIRNTERRVSPEAAVDVFLEKVIENSQDKPGWFRALLNGLEEADPANRELCRLIEGQDDIPDYTVFRNLLICYAQHLKLIDPLQLLPYLQSKGCLRLEEVQEITTETRNEGTYHGARELLFAITRGNTKEKLKHFIGSLQDNGQKWIVDIIDPSLNEAESDASLDMKLIKLQAANEMRGCSRDAAEGDSDDPITTSIHYSEEGDTAKKLESEIPEEGLTSFSGEYTENPLSKGDPKVMASLEDNFNIPVSKPGTVDKGGLGPSEVETALKEKINADESNQLVNDGASGPVETLKLRPYQTELAEPALNGDNIIVIAPTGSGKTHVAMYIVKVHFENAEAEDESKVVFFVPTNALVEQQKNVFQKYNKAGKRITSISGSTTRDAPFSGLVETYDIIIMTPQIMVDAITNGELDSISKFSLLVFDECHHALKGHMYAMIMYYYLKEKHEERDGQGRACHVPQVVGMTASVGVGKARTIERAMDHILHLCANLDVEHISRVRKHRAELQGYVNKPDEESQTVKKRETDYFLLAVSPVMTRIEGFIKSKAPDLSKLKDYEPKLLEPPAAHGQQAYTNWLGNMKRPRAKISNQELRRYLTSCMRHLEAYQKALQLNDDCETAEALAVLEKDIGNIDMKYADEIDEVLHNLFRDKKKEYERIRDDPRNKNPKLVTLKQAILSKHEDYPDLRAIVFCKTRELAAAICSWMEITPGLKELKPGKLVGARASVDKLGMSPGKQVDVLEFFRTGDHMVMVATSVGEEGLDISKCNVVIRYENVTNEIAMVQARGRSRAEDATYTVIGGEAGGTIQKEDINRMRESMMNEALQKIDYMAKSEVKSCINRYQREFMTERHVEQMKREIRRLHSRQHNEDDHELRCVKCGDLACFLSDVRTIEKSHHAVIDEQFKDCMQIRPHPRPVSFGSIAKTHKIHCKNCNEDWGIGIKYKGSLFPVIKICSFTIVNNNEEVNYIKKWKELPFSIEKLTADELLQCMNKELMPTSGI